MSVLLSKPELYAGAQPTMEWIVTELIDGVETVVDLSGGTVHFHYRFNGAAEVDRVADIVDAVNGVCEYLWQPSELVEGTLMYQWVFIDAASQPFPSAIIERRVHPQLAALKLPAEAA